MKLLVRAGLGEARQFGDGHTRFEAARSGKAAHHDHLICTACGHIDELVNEKIESLQTRVAKEHDFVVTHHKRELHGLCTACAAAASS